MQTWLKDPEIPPVYSRLVEQSTKRIWNNLRETALRLKDLARQGVSKSCDCCSVQCPESHIIEDRWCCTCALSIANRRIAQIDDEEAS